MIARCAMGVNQVIMDVFYISLSCWYFHMTVIFEWLTFYGISVLLGFQEAISAFHVVAFISIF